MKKSLREHLAESLSVIPSDEQQAEREALKANKLTPSMAAALAMLLHEALDAPKSSAAPAQTPAELATLLAEVRAVKTAVEKKTEPVSSCSMSEKEKHEVLKRLGGIEDTVRAIRPGTFKALLVCLLLGGVIGGAAGWYACVSYHTSGVRHRPATVEAE
jgi:hypothetical protein